MDRPAAEVHADEKAGSARRFYDRRGDTQRGKTSRLPLASQMMRFPLIVDEYRPSSCLQI
jgi:hypothetical protein